MLQAIEVSKQFGKEMAVDHVSLTVKSGSIVSLIGPSGGGKTSFLRCLASLDKPDGGTVKCAETKGKRRWPTVTMVFQQLFLWPHLTLRQNILLPINLEQRMAAEAELVTLSRRFDIDLWLDKYPNQVSLGQQQRAALVRAFITKPKYLLLDEITSAQDVEHVAVLAKYLKELRKNGVGIVLVTHLVGLAYSLSDQVYFLERGRVIESGTRAIIKSPKGERLRKFMTFVEPIS